ncbi:MAG: phosphate signaling complex protein PhoU [Gaiellaceae bacterium]
MAIDEALDRIEAQLQEEGQRVVSAVRGAMRALQERDVELAEEVIAFDDEIDALFLGIEASIQSLLALQTPVARDLRLLLAILHINLLLERQADSCVTVAKLSKLVSDVEPDPALVEVLVEMGERAEEMCRVALDSFDRRDLPGAESLVELDELIDRANRRFVERLIDVMAEPSLREWGLRMVVVARTIERIGDRAVDIGEQTAYLLTAEFREFTDASHPAASAVGSGRRSTAGDQVATTSRPGRSRNPSPAVLRRRGLRCRRWTAVGSSPWLRSSPESC